MQQQYITVLFTVKLFNPVSWLIRWALPRSRLALALSSHAIVVDGDHAIEASMIYGVRRAPLAEILKGAKVVRANQYPVDDAEAGLAWFRGQVCTYVPRRPAGLPKTLQELVAMADLLLHNNYDFKGALGLEIAPDRDWQCEDKWFCYEGAAGALLRAGLDVFADLGHITETVLLGIRHRTVAWLDLPAFNNS